MKMKRVFSKLKAFVLTHKTQETPSPIIYESPNVIVFDESKSRLCKTILPMPLENDKGGKNG